MFLLLVVPISIDVVVFDLFGVVIGINDDFFLMEFNLLVVVVV